MKTLYLLRHAKSSWDQSSLPDYDRPLNERGRRAAPVMGELMRKKGYMPDLVQCSPAVRADETMTLVLSASGGQPEVSMEPRLYLAKRSTMLSVLKRTRGEPSSILMIGHNPGLQRFAHALAGEGDKQVLRSIDAKYPTAALSVFTFDIGKWAEADFGQAVLTDYIRPRDIMLDED